MIDTLQTERAVLVGLERQKNKGLWGSEDSLQELAQLAHTAGIYVAGQAVQRLSHPQPTTYIGAGKVEELRAQIAASRAGTVLFDDELSPDQQRTLERLFGEEVKVLDRTALILDIFARHAHTREGILQVELAQYEYRLPRLTRSWTHLIRQAGGHAAGAIGGVGLRGPGETQLETDRRQIHARIASLKQELEAVRAHRRQQYRQRRRTGIRSLCLVGYTNAGKSSLFNALTEAQEGEHGRRGGVLVANQLFSTLDPTTRRIRLPGGAQALITDTVGFINKLPHHLVAAFRATLEGIQEADLLLHVADVTHPRAEAHLEAGRTVLRELEVMDKPQLVVWNKIDLAPDPSRRHWQAEDGFQATSAVSREGLPELLAKVERLLLEDLVALEVEIPYGADGLKHQIFTQGTVEWVRYEENGTRIKAHLPPALAAQLQSYRRFS